ncbi:MAG: FAD-dependent oxidoreductase [Thermoplasmata archaeon]|jgi:NADPH-dependent 2,4-dienoyl-CoA reductase/sulfur reductase-like enzyme
MIVIIGLGTAGVYATRWITQLNREEEITIIEKHAYESYSPCGIPLIFEESGDFNVLKHPFPRTKRINVLLNHEAIKVDPENKIVRVRDIEKNTEKEIGYDKLLFAAGADPLVPPIKNAREYLGNGVFVVKTLEDADLIKKFIGEKNVKSVGVIGAGAIGLEMAHSMLVNGIKVHVFEMFPQVFPRALDPDMADIVAKFIMGLGIELHLSSRVDEIVVENGKIKGIVSSGKTYECESVILATGVVPNTKILDGIVKMERNFILVNERMETSRKDIFAAGDCVLVKSFINGDPVAIQLATTAAKQGIVAGINMAGKDATYSGALGAFVSTIGSLEVAAVGFTETYLKDKVEVVSARARALDKPDYAGGEEIILKVVADKSTGKILGAQALGKKASSKIDIISMAMKKGSTAMDLSSVEISYCPAVSELYDVVNMAGDLLLRKLNPENYRF